MTVIEEIDSNYVVLMITKVRNYTGYDSTQRTDDQISLDLDDAIEWLEEMMGTAFDETVAKQRRLSSIYASGIATDSMTGANVVSSKVDEVQVNFSKDMNKWFKLAYNLVNKYYGGALIGMSTYDGSWYKTERAKSEYRLKEELTELDPDGDSSDDDDEDDDSVA